MLVPGIAGLKSNNISIISVIRKLLGTTASIQNVVAEKEMVTKLRIIAILP
jgi:hypothetical protein